MKMFFLKGFEIFFDIFEFLKKKNYINCNLHIFPYRSWGFSKQIIGSNPGKLGLWFLVKLVYDGLSPC